MPTMMAVSAKKSSSALFTRPGDSLPGVRADVQ
ncbi:hypothetical protein Gohar_002006 [Gossypium harknessii]|uniref:Uncharacterized protein n=4 Tax=Gossypium TaxID=3633 RepID=A0A7J9JWI5_9ROSI|nr:hypothetical protein [Gossypium davidsonii]MBA0661224.1 hypothetical protein [Gossypium klotzschianum]MBA0809983.1 hypothetical protein [Gossypium harknessii]MBA0838508.1 hypothetical protein [Gossypium armourianum]